MHYMVELDYYNPDVEEDGNLEEIENLIIAHMNSTGRLISLSLSNEEAVFWLVLRVEKEDAVSYTHLTLPTSDLV